MKYKNIVNKLFYLQASYVGNFMLNTNCHHSSWHSPYLKMSVEEIKGTV